MKEKLNTAAHLAYKHGVTVVRWHRCACGAIAAAGLFFGYFLWASKESNITIS